MPRRRHFKLLPKLPKRVVVRVSHACAGIVRPRRRRVVGPREVERDDLVGLGGLALGE